MKGQVVGNALNLPCVADELRIVRDVDELAERLVEADARGRPVTLLGGGTNVVLRPRLGGLVLQPFLRGLTACQVDARRWRVVAAAGETWHEVVRATLGQGISGLENLALIPGTVGAAPVQNIGAYGRELAEVIDYVEVFDRDRQSFRRLGVEECRFRYRHSHFKDDESARYVIVRIAMLLGGKPVVTDYPDVERELARMGEAEDTAKAVATAEAVVRVRRRKLPDPRHIGNVGSFFKNPVLTPRQLDDVRSRLNIDGHPAGDDGDHFKVSAARLIDSAGWKGVQRGAVQAWPRQPLVLVNHGGASCDEVLDFANRLRDDVARKYGVRLALEPTILGTR